MPGDATQRFRLDGEVAVVTGAFGKLGPIWTEALLDAGARVLALDRREAPHSFPFAQLVKATDPERLVVAHADVRDRDALERACEHCAGSLGTPSVLVNNAGIDQPPAASGGGHRLEEIPLALNREIFEVNTLGLFLVSQVFGARMVAAGRGSIVNIGSLYAGVAPDTRLYDHLPADPPFLKPPAYGASKAAVVNLTRYLATLWAPHGVRVNALSPGGVLGGQDPVFQRKFCARVPLGRMATPEDLKGPLLFLASAASSYVTGAELVVDGGFTAW
jgi:NAD(P)-dependent dehydrogenase (short-subunit alcohol dehydrogenase family)